ncbi:Beta-hexosaminidase [compost metagenome]
MVSETFDELAKSDFLPFVAMKDEVMAMSAHMVFTAIDPDNPATTSAKVVREIIRGHIGFDGLLMSDDVSMNALAGDMATRARNIIDAGLDLVLHCHGIMEEMRAVAFRKPDNANEQELRAEFNGLFATV